MVAQVSIVIADDHPMFRHGLKQVIETQPNWVVVGEAGDGLQALDLIRTHRPSIALLDISMPGRTGFEVAEVVSKQHEKVAIIFLTAYRNEEFYKRSLELNAQGYVLKDSAVTDIVSAITSVSSGEHFMSPAFTSYLVKSTTSRKERAESVGTDALSASELRVLEMIAEYKTTQEIARELCISPRTVGTHRTNICQKVGLHGRHGLMKFALEHKSSPKP